MPPLPSSAASQVMPLRMRAPVEASSPPLVRPNPTRSCSARWGGTTGSRCSVARERSTLFLPSTPPLDWQASTFPHLAAISCTIPHLPHLPALHRTSPLLPPYRATTASHPSLLAVVPSSSPPCNHSLRYFAPHLLPCFPSSSFLPTPVPSFSSPAWQFRNPALLSSSERQNLALQAVRRQFAQHEGDCGSSPVQSEGLGGGKGEGEVGRWGGS